MSTTIGIALTPDHPFIDTVLQCLQEVYGTRLVSVALFGSVARRTARPDSDLDLFLVVEDLPRGHGARFATFDPVERRLVPAIEALRAAGTSVELSPILRTPTDVRTASPLMLDLTEDAAIRLDRGNVLTAALEDLRSRLRRLGSRRIWVGTEWYWDLKPDYQRGERFEL